MNSDSEETVDLILDGRLRIVQPRKGYRFSIDSILLARFTNARPHERILELGAGCGVVSIMIGALHHPRSITALEVQAALARLIERNAMMNEIAVTTICADLRDHEMGRLRPGSFDLVVANPPYRALRSGRLSPNVGRRAARSSVNASLRDFIAAAQRWVRFGGRVAMVFAASRTAELIDELRCHRLEPKRIRFVHARLDAPASVVLVEARKGGGIEVAIEPPLVLHDRNGSYTQEARRLLNSA